MRVKANRTFQDQDRAEVGIGTLIVFIATILVAAVASAVLINTSNKLQEKAQATGSQATQQVATNLKIDQVIGKIQAASGTQIDALNISVELAAGAKQLDLNQTVIRITDGKVEKRLTYDQGDSSDEADHFNATVVRDADASFSPTSPVLTAGDLVSVNIDLSSAANGMALDPRVSVEMELVPEVGAPVAAEFTTPSTYATSTVFTLA